MKKYQFPCAAFGVAAVLFAHTASSWAGFSSERLGITHVPIGGETSDKDLMNIVERNGDTYGPINEPVSPEDITKLQGHKDFQGLSAVQVQNKIVKIRRTVLCAIDMLRRSDPAAADGLRGLFRAGMISVGIAPEGFKGHAGIRDDGTKAFHLEPINLYEPPCESFGNWDAGLFDMINTLSNMAFYAQQDFKGLRDSTAQEVAKDRQCKQIDAAVAELDRVNKMLAVIESIESTGQVPDDARGMFAAMGISLINHNVSNPARMEIDRAAWKRTLNGLKQKAGARRTYWEAQKRGTELEVAGHPDSGQVRLGLRQQTIFQDTGQDPFTGLINRWYSNVTTGIEETPGEPPRVVPGNMMKQLVSPATTPETFQVNFLDTICAGYVWEEENKALIGGIRFGIGGAEDEGRVITYDLDPTTKRIIPESERLSFGTPLMGGGYSMSFNPVEGKFYALQPDGVLCEFVDTDDDDEPDFAQLAGQIALGRLDYRLDFSSFFFADGDTAIGLRYKEDAPVHINDRLGITWRDHGSAFMPQPDEEFLDGLSQRPGFDGRVDIGSQYAPLTGTPLGGFQLFDNEVKIAEGTFSPHGFASPHLTNPFSMGSRLRLFDEESGRDSVEGIPSLPFGNTPNVEIIEENDYSLSIGLKYEVNPSLSIKIDYLDIELDELNNQLDELDWESVESRFPDRFGRSFFDIPGTDSRARFFRGVSTPITEIETTPDNFEIVPGSLNYFDVSKNDNLPPSARYMLVGPPIPFGDPGRAFSEVGFQFFPDGTFYVAMPTFASSLSFTYRVCIGDTVSAEVAVLVAVFVGEDVFRDGRDVGEDPFGNPLIEALFLEIGGLSYPAFQFRLGPPEPLNPMDGSGCVEIHWHGGPAYPFENPFALPITDMFSTSCGFGTYTEFPLRRGIVLKSAWQEFLDDIP